MILESDAMILLHRRLKARFLDQLKRDEVARSRLGSFLEFDCLQHLFQLVHAVV